MREAKAGQEHHVVDEEVDAESHVDYVYIIRSGTVKLIKVATKQCPLNRAEKLNLHVMNLGVGEIINEAPLTGYVQNFSVQVLS